MAYVLGDDILDTEYNDFIGASGTAAYASQVAVDAAAPCVGAIYGVGYGDRGYGQTTITLTAITAGTVISSAQWTDMRDALAVCSESQDGSPDSLIPPATELEAGDLIQAHESDAPTSDTYDFNSVISDIDTNRFVLDATKDGTFSTITTSSDTRTSSWGSGTGSIDCQFNYDFGSEDDARYFFNSGGEIRIDLSHPTGSSQDNNWNTALGTALGQVRMGYTATTSTGTSALSSSVGFYDLTDSFQTILDGTNIGTGAYSANDVLIEARRLNFSGVNGGNGDGVRVRITLTDQHTNAFSDTVSSGTAASFTVLKATFLSGIITPTGSLTDTFD